MKSIHEISRLIFLGLITAVLFLSAATKEVRPSMATSLDTHPKVWGIDISHHQGTIHWDRMSSKKPQFIFMKATEGSTFSDPKYKYNRKQAKKLNIPVGAYHFFSYQSSGKSQAEHFLRTIKGDDLELPLVLDLEYSNRMMPASKLRKEIKAFVQTIKAATGKAPMFYGECSYYKRYVDSSVNLKWISSMKGAPVCGYDFWQKTARYSHPAFAGRIDYNLFNGTKEELLNLKK